MAEVHTHVGAVVERVLGRAAELPCEAVQVKSREFESSKSKARSRPGKEEEAEKCLDGVARTKFSHVA